MTPEPERFQEMLRPVFGGRKVVFFGGPIAALAGISKAFFDLGIERALLMANGRGTGPLPTDERITCHELPVRGEGMLEAMLAHERLCADLPDEARAVVDAFDPDGEAIAIATIVLGPIADVAGRRVYAPRPESWAALEDKLAIDAFWDAAGVPRAPSECVPATLPAIRAAAASLDRGHGVAVAGDASEQLHGGATRIRRVFDDATLEEAAAFFGRVARRVRVMPFLEGIPCSIHGIVLPDGVAVFRPVEMVTLRRPGEGRLVYSGFGTFWDPPLADRDAMRSVARRAGEALRARVGYRGAFTVDGVLATDGFLPTEMNPRIGAGLALMARGLPDMPLLPLALAIADGEELGLGAAELEEAVLPAADATRSGRAHATAPGHQPEERLLRLGERDGVLMPVGDDEPALGVLGVGPGAGGAFVFFAPVEGAVAPGASFAPLAARALSRVGDLLGVELGELEPAAPAR